MILTEKVETTQNIAIIMAGAPGSGKSSVVDYIKNTFGFIEINPDLFKELTKSTPDEADTLAYSRFYHLIKKGRGIIFNYTARHTQQIEDILNILEQEYNYKAIMVYVWFDDIELVKQRISKRERVTDFDYAEIATAKVRENYDIYKKIFNRQGRRFFIFNSFYDKESIEYTKEVNLLISNIKRSLRDLPNESFRKVSGFKSWLSSLDEGFAPINNLESYEEARNIIEEECSTFLSYYRKGSNLYRGFGKNVDVIGFISHTPTNRIPKDSPLILHQNLNEVFDFWNFKTNRSNSIFCVRDRSVTLDYGDPYIIFPFDSFEFLWSPVVEDAYSDFYAVSEESGMYIFLSKVFKYWKYIESELINNDYTKITFRDFTNFTFDRLRNVINHDGINIWREFMNDFEIPEIQNLFDFDPEEFQKQFRYTDTNLNSYMNTIGYRTHEIMISNCNYVAIKETQIKNVFGERLSGNKYLKDNE